MFLGIRDRLGGLEKSIPAFVPHNDLCVVIVNTSQCLKGEGVASLNEARDVSDVHYEDSITSSEMARNLATHFFFSTCSRVLSPVVVTLP